MTFDTSSTDWTTARKKLAPWQEEPRASDIFAGESELHTALVENVMVRRLMVRPLINDGAAKTLAPVSRSYAVCHEADWQVEKASKSALPVKRGTDTAGIGNADTSGRGNSDTSGLGNAQSAERPDAKSVRSNSDNWPYGLTWVQAKAGRFDFHFDLPPHVRCLGLGERFSDLNLRGQKHTLFATDNPHHNEHADMLYKSIPFLILADGASYTGIFVDSPAPQRWHLDTELTGRAKIELFTRRGFYLYVFPADSLANLVQAFTRLTGRAPLPPRWSLGHQQCRWSYPDEATIRHLAQQFRQRKIPCDTLVLDIDYMDEYRVFTHSKERFPSFPKLAEELSNSHFKLITIVDPGVKKDDKFEIYRQGKGQDLFCKTARGEIFIETVWPGLSAFPDFLRAETRLWWQEKLKFYLDHGIAGIWNDMNEPAMFNSQRPLPDPFIEMPEDNRQLFLQRGEDGPVGHFEVRNLYGFLMALATYNALLQQRPNERPFVLTRSGSTGVQRHAAVWLGDNTSWFEHLQKSLPMLLNIGLSGVSFAGVDIGGFGGDTTPELLVRWYEIGIFYPFFRNHCALMGRAQEPFAFSKQVEGMVRHLIEMRYRLLPYIQNLFWQHSRTGAPLMRPLAWHYNDEMSLSCEDQFMFGEDVMVAPILNANQSSRYVYFPPGNWFSFDDALNGQGQAISGARTHRIKFPLGRVPAFVREGAILALADIMQNTDEFDQKAITFYCFGNEAQGRHFEDDGHSLNYQKGEYNEWNLRLASGKLERQAVHNGLKGSNQNYFFKLAGDQDGPLLPVE